MSDDRDAKKLPVDIAADVLREYKIMRDELGVFYQYTGVYWRTRSEPVLRAYAANYDVVEHLTVGRLTAAVEFIGIQAQRFDPIRWNCGIGLHELPHQGGVLNLLTGATRPHRPEDWLDRVVPHTYDPSAACPTWEAVLTQWEMHPSAIAALQEFFGYVLMPHARFKKAMVCYGIKDTGKSQVGHVLRSMVGEDHVCSLQIDELGDSRKVAPIVGKMLNIVSEIGARTYIDDAGFKRLVSDGDAISIDPKNQHPFSYVPTAKHVFMTNFLPKTADDSDATLERIMLIPFNRRFAQHEQDRDLSDKLRGEMPGILSWAVEGARRLMANNGRFTPVEGAEVLLEQYKEDQNPVLQFLRERYIATNDSSRETITLDQFRNEFNDWHGKTLSPRAIALMMARAGVTSAVRNSTRFIVGYQKSGNAMTAESRLGTGTSGFDYSAPF